MITIQQLKMPIRYKPKDVRTKILKMLRISEDALYSYEITKESLDARKKPELFYVLNVTASCKDEAKIVKKLKNRNIFLTEEKRYQFPTVGASSMTDRPIIVGSGPSGLYCAYFLAKNGYKPLVLERGEDVDARFKSVQTFWENGILNPESNVQFGEGGAGTFSDGKLNTLNKDPFLRNKEVLKVFVEMGAKESILYEQKPHLGTDVLMKIVKNLRNEIVKLGGKVCFNAKVTDLLLDKEKSVCGVVVNHSKTIKTNVVVLAIGHSARDTFSMLYEKGIPMQAKDFAIGYRVMHPQEKINLSQYGTKHPDEVGLMAASYKLTAQTNAGRGVFSFCMCPGGYVVNASSEENRLVVNGMSYSGRDSKTANSAIVVSVKTNDFESKHPLAGMYFQQKIEEAAYKAGEGKIPLQLYRDFKSDKISDGFETVSPCLKGDYKFANIRTVLPKELSECFIEAMEQFGNKIDGFADDDVIVAGVETRTSAPVRIIRESQSLESEIKGLYPCGEGAGYAGGITSAAADGIRIAEEIAKKFQPI